jgi:hypothetical protein
MSSPDSSSPREALDESWQRGFAWIEQQLGGTLVSWDPQLRWRPAWFLELERGTERVPLYWRGARPEFHTDTGPLEKEMKIIQVLERHGIPVPHAHGICEDPPGLLLDCVPGRFNLATEPDAALRVATLDHYIELLAQVHQIPVAEFEAAGLVSPESPERSCLGDLPPVEQMYRANKKRPDPILEFQLGWLKRNVPKDRPDTAFVVCDSGQFLFDAGRVTALLDFELGYIGDPAADLAGLRTRDVTEPLGDLTRAMARYAEVSGTPVDPAAVDYHTIRFSLVTPLSVANMCAEPFASTNYVQYLAWYVVYARCAFEVQAHRLGIELDPPTLPEAAPSRRGVAHRHLVGALFGAAERAEGERQYDLDRMARVAHYVERSDRFGPALAADDLDDAEKLLGHRPGSWERADAELEELVLASGPERDADFIRAFHRRMVREEFLMRGTMRETEDATMPPID